MSQSAVVWATWVAVTLTGIWYVVQYGLTIPIWDDWNLIPAAVGQQPITLDWLWSFEVDHRIPLPKLLFVVLYRLSGQDLRAIMLLNVALLSLAAFLGLLVARRRAGRTRFTDAVIPLSLGGIANYSNLLSANQIHYMSSIALFSVVAYLLLSTEQWFTLPRIALLAMCAVCLPLTGTTGLALAVPLLVVLPAVVWLHRRRPERSVRMACWTAGGAAVVLAAIVLTYNALGNRPVPPVSATAWNIQQAVTTLVQFAAVGFAAPPFTFSVPAALPDGIPSLVAAYFSPDWVNRTWQLRAAVVLAAGATAVLGLVWPVVRGRVKASAAPGPLACLASVGVLALAIGYARESGLEQRYIVLGATVVLGIYLCLTLQRHWTAGIAAWALLGTSLVLLPWNIYQGISFGNTRRAFEVDLVGDIRAGVPADVLGAMYYEQIWGDPGLATSAIKKMRDDHIGPFANGDLVLNDGRISSDRALRTTPTAINHVVLAY